MYFHYYDKDKLPNGKGSTSSRGVGGVWAVVAWSPVSETRLRISAAERALFPVGWSLAVGSGRPWRHRRSADHRRYGSDESTLGAQGASRRRRPIVRSKHARASGSGQPIFRYCKYTTISFIQYTISTETANNSGTATPTSASRSSAAACSASRRPLRPPTSSPRPPGDSTILHTRMSR